MVCVVKVVIFYTTSAKWEERFYHGVVDRVKSPAFDSWACERSANYLYLDSTGFYLSNEGLVEGPCNHDVTSQKYLNMDD